jgi:hypothetical protein
LSTPPKSHTAITKVEFALMPRGVEHRPEIIWTLLKLQG